MPPKYFRLFVSSTFANFKDERNLLQREVFPKVQQYCNERGYQFQAIDLRWGVAEEAQLNQRTLELCLKEVKNCKQYPHPNFLIMLGDRYGWIPLPYDIKKDEYENILNEIENSKKKELLNSWYKLDYNQLPLSYLLKERCDEYVNYEKWESIENKLRGIFQKAVKRLKEKNIYFNEKNKLAYDKYFLSATEEEVISGICKYKEILEHQKDCESEIDKQYVFAYINGDIQDENSREFKDNLEKVLPKENLIYSKNNSIFNKLFNKTKNNFANNIYDKLINSIQIQIDFLQTQNLNENDFCQHQSFKDDRLEVFIGRDDILNQIDTYITSKENIPLLIYGVSGIGKSSIMAKAIEKYRNSQAKLIYKFIGASASSLSTVKLLTTIAKALGYDIEYEDSFQQDSLKNFFNELYSMFFNIKEPTIIFIDALDQLSDKHEPVWLPSRLPENLKIIFSTLKDDNYVEDSFYFDIFNSRIDKNHIEIKPLKESDAKKILIELLKKENRTLQDFQLNYCLEQYNKTKTSLYLKLISQEVKYWKGYDYIKDNFKTYGREQSLESGNIAVVDEFIDNLSNLYFHNKLLVEKVLGYLSISEEGLTEVELIELLSCDEDLMNEINTYAQTDKLPTVVLSRLLHQISPFLKKNIAENKYEVMEFFHREFTEAVKLKYNQQELYEELISYIQILILDSIKDDISFDSNRYGILYALISTNYIKKYPDPTKIEQYTNFIINLNNDEWTRGYIVVLKDISNDIKYINLELAVVHDEINKKLLEHLNLQNTNEWRFIYLTILNNLMVKYLRQHKDTTYYIKYLPLFKKELIRNNKFDFTYSQFLLNLSSSFAKQDIKQALKYAKESFDIRQKLYIKNKKFMADKYIGIISQLLYLYNLDKVNFDQNFNKILKLEKYVRDDVIHYLNLKNDNDNIENYLVYLANLSNSYFYNSDIDTAIQIRQESFKFLEKPLKDNFSKYISIYIACIENLVGYYVEQNTIYSSFQINKLAKNIISIFSSCNINNYFKEIYNDYVEIIGSLVLIYYKFGFFREGQILLTNLKDLCKIHKIQTSFSQNHLFEFEKTIIKQNNDYKKNIYQLEIYSMNIDNQTKEYQTNKKFEKAIQLYQENLQIINYLFIYYEKNEKWSKIFSTILHNFAQCYFEKYQYNLNKKIFINQKDLIDATIIEKEACNIIKDYDNKYYNLYKYSYEHFKNHLLDDNIKREMEEDFFFLQNKVKEMQQSPLAQVQTIDYKVGIFYTKNNKNDDYFMSW